MTASGADLRQQLRGILGDDGIVDAGAASAPYLTDHRRLYQGRALAVVRPRSVAQVSQVLARCNAARVGVVPHGGNTSYCGGATPDASGAQIVLALERLNRIREVDVANDSLVAEAGCLLAQVQAVAAQAQRFFPLSLGSQGSCQIGGNLSTNAGGTSVLRYGMMRDLVLGLEVVLADGRVLNALAALRKDNTGYDIKSLFLGAEGTLGVITAATLKLFPEIRARATALAAVADVRAAVALLRRLREASSERVSSFEILPRIALELTVRHIPGVRDPFATPYPWYALCELSSSRAADPLDGILEEALGAALGQAELADAVIAHSERERELLWQMRENIPEAQRREGVGLKHDISVPVSRLADFVARAAPWIEVHVPNGRLIAYGHAGDGNLHFNVSALPGADAARFLARAEAVQRAVHDWVHEFGGSFSAEHGIGRLKVGELERYASPVELSLMRAVKQAFDPHNIMNPGKVLR
ncbi:MAG: FAD-binding oxidoreductase [Steroidobacteraceae bacterium]